ncbi:interferon-related developmental regulator-domain-containing protein [Tribonema minus]|uniref:Interferon-related developmental regulator-domain-containing protein n=1 Tax=Tribonema minus TaxID=303371 RepID=A0A835YVX4_9STRA|nr:interferon-related developmental regulator-domain-containing protein [Tribonema minus]
MGRRKGGHEKESSARSARDSHDDHDDDIRSTTSHDTIESGISHHSAGLPAPGGRRAARASGGGAHPLGANPLEDPDENGAGEGGAANGDEDAPLDPLSDALDKLGEKRSATRLAGLGALLTLLQAAADLDAIHARRAALAEAVLACLRRPAAPAEAEAAARAAAALCVCLGAEEDELYRQLARLLTTSITRGKHEGSRVEACRALAMACFVCSSDDDANDEALATLSAVFSRTSEGTEVTDDVAAAALRGWCLLATAGPREWLGGPALEALLPAVRDLLAGGASLDVREAAGEAAALMREAADALRAAQAEAGIEEAAAEEYSDVETLWQEIGDLMQGYSTETSKRMSKDTKKSQRRTFRDLHAAVVEGAPPPWQELSLQSCAVEITTWAELVRLEALRACLHGGLQSQAAHNATVRDILGAVDGGGAAGGTPALAKSGGARKYRSETRSRQRASRQNAKDSFLWDEGA